jgi:dihydrofolate synthase/folylpolyglutamate synthase
MFNHDPLTMPSLPLPNHRASLEQWLLYLEQAAPDKNHAGLSRMMHMNQRLGLVPTCPIITVAGTNGKGSTCAMLSQILTLSGYKVGRYTSPHLEHYHERIAINNQPVTDALIAQHFHQITQTEPTITLSYFELGTLAAIAIFMEAKVDVMILEVGLGGRLDATNAYDADIAVITNIDLDHQAILGDTREAIGLEKAGIIRSQRPVVCGDMNPPSSLRQHAQMNESPFYAINEAFRILKHDTHWDFIGSQGAYYGLPYPALRGEYQLSNAANVLMTLQLIHDLLPVSIAEIKQGLLKTLWPARFQVLPGQPMRILDAAHNEHAAKALAQALKKMPYAPKRVAVFSVLKDKAIEGMIEALRPIIDCWYIAPLSGDRALPVTAIESALLAAKVPSHQIMVMSDPVAAYQQAYQQAALDDQIIVFGSFILLATILPLINIDREALNAL